MAHAAVFRPCHMDTQVHHATPPLQVADGQCAQLHAAQAEIKQRGQDGVIAPAAQGGGVRRAQQGACLVATDGGHFAFLGCHFWAHHSLDQVAADRVGLAQVVK